jgi:hypothetical protein
MHVADEGTDSGSHGGRGFSFSPAGAHPDPMAAGGVGCPGLEDGDDDDGAAVVG